jgi:hypothetical protein
MVRFPTFKAAEMEGSIPKNGTSCVTDNSGANNNFVHNYKEATTGSSGGGGTSTVMKLGLGIGLGVGIPVLI